MRIFLSEALCLVITYLMVALWRGHEASAWTKLGICMPQAVYEQWAAAVLRLYCLCAVAGKAVNQESALAEQQQRDVGATR